MSKNWIATLNGKRLVLKTSVGVKADRGSIPWLSAKIYEDV